MRLCSGTIGRALCPCEEYIIGSTDGACGACFHSFTDHHRPSVIPLRSSTNLAPGRAATLASLFKQATKSTQSGGAALRETSDGLRKRQVVRTISPAHCMSVRDVNHKRRACRVGNRPLCGGQPYRGRAAFFAFAPLFSLHVAFGTARR